MIISLLYVLLAIFGLSLLIFIHELGHYYMARKVGMKVEVFSIGFGKPVYSWVKDGVKWQIGWLLFGGYVKIVGMDTQDERNLCDIEEGFFSKPPLDQIKVAFMGPFVNIVFSLLVFTLLWSLGGRVKHFSDYTHKIGWVDPKSELYIKGIRPGDEILAYNQHCFQSAKDHVSAPMTSPEEIEVRGYHVNFFTNERTPFDLKVNTYSHPAALDKDVLTAGILNSANYVIYAESGNGKQNPLPEGSPMTGSGLQQGDRIVWADGVPIYSLQELTHVINESKVLLTIQRDQEIVLRRVPRVPTEELRISPSFKEELIDWQHESKLTASKIQKLFILPYDLNNECVVEDRIKFIDHDAEEVSFPKHLFSRVEAALEVGDKILAVDGHPVKRSYEILSLIQQRHINIVVQRGSKNKDAVSWKVADAMFDGQYKVEDLQKLIARLGLPDQPQVSENLVRLNPVVPKKREDLQVSPEIKEQLALQKANQMKEIENIEDPEKRTQVKNLIAKDDQQLILGIPGVSDQQIYYNPGPFTLFKNVFEEIWYTLKALFTGSLNPKWMSGPIGIVQVVHDTSMVSLKESLYWLGAISLNLGILNLLPVPVLDGGTICFAILEMITGKRIKKKTLERLLIPFAVLLIGFFIFLTYHDVMRIFKNFIG